MEKKITECFKYTNFSHYAKYTVPSSGFKILLGTQNGTTNTSPAAPPTHNIYTPKKQA